jgi:hypothetical protein
VDGDLLIGTPEFDMNDEFAKKIAQKWDKDFLRMASAGIEIKEVSVEPSMLVPGQTRPTITKSKLLEVSIVDIGANDDALRLMKGGKVLTLASGEECDVLPLLAKPAEPATKVAQEKQNDNNNTINNNENMNEKINLALGLSKDATEAEALAAIVGLQSKAKEVETLQLAAITSAVNVAIAEKRITEANRDHFINLGKKDGINPRAFMGFVNRVTNGTKLDLGRIDLMTNFSFFEVPEAQAKTAISLLAGQEYDGRKVNVELTDGKDSGKGSRGGRGSRSAKSQDFKGGRGSRDERGSRKDKGDNRGKRGADRFKSVRSEHSKPNSGKPSREERGYTSKRGPKGVAEWAKFFEGQVESQPFYGEVAKKSKKK